MPQYATPSFDTHARGTSWLLATVFADAAPDTILGIVNPRFMIGYPGTAVDTIAERIHAEAPTPGSSSRSAIR